ncbi:MAG: DUF7144 family membrane protein [Solirubrobacterales bacterium]
MSAARRAGVVTFAGVLFLAAAFFNAVDGLVALAEPSHFYVGEEGLVIDNYDAFGIVLLIIAGLQLLVGSGILALQRWAQVVGIIVAIIGAIAAFGHFTHYPAWSVILLVLYAIILYALTVYSDEFATTSRRR